MATLRVLGPPEARNDAGEPLEGLNGQPKRLALLAFLAVGRPEGCRRDTLLGLFWPELPESRARNALRQALALLRSELGQDVVPGSGSEIVAVNPDRLRTDAHEFTALVDSESHAGALALYRGDFLEGLFVEGAPDVERWIEDRRADYRRRAARAAGRAAVKAESERQTDAAVTLAARMVEIAPYEEEAWRERIALYARLGRRAEAMECLARLRTILETDLGIAPDPKTEALAAELRHYSLPARPPVQSSDAPSDVAAAPVRAVEAARRPPARFPYRRLAIGLTAAIGVITIGAWPDAAPAYPPLDPSLVLIEPFRLRASDTTLMVMSEGLAELATIRFTGGAGPRAVDFPLGFHQWQVDSNPAESALMRRARILGAGLVLRASLLQSGSRLILSGALVSVPDGAVRSEAAAEGPLDSILPLVDQFIAQVLARNDHEGEASLADLVTRSLPALRAYLRAGAAYRRGQFQPASEEYRQALREDSTFGLAGIHLAMTSVWIGSMDARALDVAMAHRDRLPQQLYPLLDAFQGSDRTWDGGYRAWRGAAEALPNEPLAWERLGDQLYHEGGFLDSLDPFVASGDALRRASVFDSSLAVPLIHQVDLAARRGDSTAVRRLGERFLALDSTGEQAGYIRWRLLTSGGIGAARRHRLVWEDLPPASIREILGTAVLDGIGLEALDSMMRAADRTLRDQSNVGAREIRLAQLYYVHLDRARGEMADSLAQDLSSTSPQLTDYVVVMSALYGGGRLESARAALPRLEHAASARPDSTGNLRMMQAYAAGVLALWNAAGQNSREARRWIRRIEVMRGWAIPPLGRATAGTSVIIAEALLGGEVERIRLDSLVRAGPLGNLMTEAAAALTLADLEASAGHLPAARRALTRRRYYQPLPVYTAAFLERQIQFARRAGDSVAVARSERHLRALRVE
jgi:DNA-binding SARP family transcriptional activator